MIRLTIMCLLLFISSQGFTNPLMKEVSEQVLDNLYKANGNQIFLKPKIKITNDEKNGALFLRRANTIELSKKAYRTCQSFGKDSLSALAFILGHELAHSYETELEEETTSFLAYDRHLHGRTFFEEAADLQGVFMAYLAGYKTLDIMPQVIDKIYDEFGLNSNLSGYPPLLERQNTTKKVQKMTKELVHIYEAGNYLLAIGKYDMAVSCFEHVENWYKGREVYNNLGVSLTYLAMNFSEKNAEALLFPLEVNWSTRMKKPLAERGSKDLDPEERRLRESYLIAAEKHFATASKMNPQYILPEINIMCVLILKGEHQGAIDYYTSHGLLKKAQFLNEAQTYRQRIRLVLALAYAYNNEGEKAVRIWEDIKTATSGLEAFQADYNLKTWKGEKCEIGIVSECPDVPGTDVLVDNYKPHRPDLSGTWIPLNARERTQLSILEKTNSLVYVFDKNNIYFSLQRIFKLRPSTVNDLNNESAIFTDSGSITCCEQARLSFLLDKQGKIVEWAKYY